MPIFNSAALSSLSPLDQHRFQILGAGPSTSVSFECLHHAFEHHARLTPYALAVEHACMDQSITYLELDRAANRLAGRLRTMGIRPGKRVCLLSRRSIVHVMAVLAVLKAGGQYVPLDGESITEETLSHVLRDSEAALLLRMEAFSQRTGGARVPEIYLEDALREDEELGADDTKPQDLSVGSDGIYVIYTSGTTGLPKGVDVAHSNVTNLLLQSPGNVNMSPGTRVASLLNIAFDMGAWELLGALANGATLCLRGDRSKHWRQVLSTVDVVIATPSILARHDPWHYPNIRDVIVAGEVCPQDLADRWATHCNFTNSCGPTEITIVNTAQLHSHGEALSIGVPVPNTTVYILDEEQQPCAIGDVGYMWAGGAGVSRGYLGLPGKTAEKYRRDPFLDDGRKMYNTGDLCRWRADGRIEMLGRVDEQVKVKGFRVELDGVAAALRTSDEVDEAVALFVEGEIWAFVTPSSADTHAVKAATALVQPHYAVPTRYLALDAFPHTRNGKVDKGSLRSIALERLSSMSAHSVSSPSTCSSPELLDTPSLDSSSTCTTPSLGWDSVLITPAIEQTTFDFGQSVGGAASFAKALTYGLEVGSISTVL